MELQNNSELIVQESELTMASHYINPRDIWDLFYTIYNGNEYACAGAMGNMQAESGLYSDNAEDLWNQRTGYTDEWLTQNINDGTISLSEFLQRSWWVNNYGFGYGLSQWTDSTRRTRLWNFTIGAGLDIDSQQGQFDYIEWEWLNTSSPYHRLLDPMKSKTTVYDATRYYCSNYEVGSWNNDRYRYALNWYDTFAGGSTGSYFVSLNVSGNGTANVTPTMAEQGDTITLTVTPANGEQLQSLDARAVSSGQSVALSFQTGTQTFPMPNDDVEITVEFTGTTPIPPIPPKVVKSKMPIWMYPCLRY